MASGPAEEGRRRRIAVPGTILGVGLGGFVDGILLHQILQWHHMLSSAGSDNLGLRPYPPDTLHGLQINTVWDGFFHVICWLAVLLGLWLLYARFTHSRGRIWASRALCSAGAPSTWSKASSTTTCSASEMIAAHATLAQLMYAVLLVRAPVPAEQLRDAADLMYYGGDLAELRLAFALLARWRPRRAPQRATDDRGPAARSGPDHLASPRR